MNDTRQNPLNGTLGKKAEKKETILPAKKFFVFFSLLFSFLLLFFIQVKRGFFPPSFFFLKILGFFKNRKIFKFEKEKKKFVSRRGREKKIYWA